MNNNSISESSGYRTYSKVSGDDWRWFIKQDPCVQQLWGECMDVEKFGESFALVETKLSRHAFEKAKRTLEEDGLFEFEPVQRKTKAGRFKIVGWKVRNLHGSKLKTYWQKDE